jgi:hypothetical protein
LIGSHSPLLLSPSPVLQTCVIDAHPKLLDFFTDEVLPLHGLLLKLLLDWSGVRVDLQMVLNHLPRDPRHL